jgi:hypothetical protein
MTSSVSAAVSGPARSPALFARGPAAAHIDRLVRYGDLVEAQVRGLIDGKLTAVLVAGNTRDQLKKTASDFLSVFQRAIVTYAAQYRAQFGHLETLPEEKFRAEESSLAACIDEAMGLLHTISRDIGRARDHGVRGMIDRLVAATSRLRALDASAKRHTYATTPLSTNAAIASSQVRRFMGLMAGRSPIEIAGSYPDKAFMRTDRLRREHDIVGWDASKAKPGAVYVIAGNWDTTLFSAHTASRIARQMGVAKPVFSVSDITLAQHMVLAQSTDKTAMATIGVGDERTLAYAHFPKAASDDCFELARNLAIHYGAAREVYVVEAVTNAAEHRSLPYAPPLRTTLSEPELVSPTADTTWVAAKRTALQDKVDGKQTVVDLDAALFAEHTAWPLAVGAATALGHRPKTSMLGAAMMTVGFKTSTDPLFTATNAASSTLISSHGVDRKRTGAPTLVTAEEQAAYEDFNARLAKKYPDLAFMLSDPEAFLAEMRARYAAQMKLTPADPYLFDYSEIGLPVLEKMFTSLSKRIPKLEAAVGKTMGQAKRRDLELGLKYYRELAVEIAHHTTNGHISYRRLHELSFFFSRAIGHFDISGVSIFKRALLQIDRGQQGYAPLPLDEEYQLFVDNKFSIFNKPTYINGFKTVQAWFETQFAKTSELAMVSVPTVSDLGTDIFHRLAWYPIHMMGVAHDGPIPADGFLRPGGDFWNHDMRHASIILSEMVKYVDQHKLTPEQLEKIRKASDVWYEGYRKRLKEVHDPKLKRAISMTYFNLHHEQGFPLAPSSYVKAHEGLHLSKALGKMLAISGQADKIKGGSFSEVEKAYEWLVDYWRTVEADEQAILN